MVLEGLWEALKVMGWALRNGVSACKRGSREIPGPFPDMRIQGHVCKGLHLIVWAPWPQTSSFWNCEQDISAVYKLLSLWYFAAQMDQNTCQVLNWTKNLSLALFLFREASCRWLALPCALSSLPETLLRKLISSYFSPFTPNQLPTLPILLPDLQIPSVLPIPTLTDSCPTTFTFIGNSA